MSSGRPTVMHLLTSNTLSGAERVALQIMSVTSDSYDPVYVSRMGSIEHNVRSEGLQYHELQRISIGGVRRAVREVKPDIIHAHDFIMTGFAALSCTGVPIVSHLHNDYPWLKNPLSPWSLAFAVVLQRLDAILTVSSSIETEYAYRRLLGNRVRVLPNVVDAERVRTLAGSVTVGDIPQQPYVMFLGRLTEQKNPQAFVRIVHSLRNAGIDVRGVMAGDGELRGEVEQLISELSLQEHIKLMGFMDNPYPLLSRAAALVMPSRYEGFGLVAVESMCLGVPVFASPVGGLVDVVDEAGGKLCSDEDAFVAELTTLLTGKGEGVYPPDSVRRSAERFCDLETYRDRIEGVYKDIEARKRTHTAS